ncbi:hypothetical protein ElP_23270 [Tautonia plasticadhaerens]|uniref:Uncharacterized protein n=1 Tax=Tautonia plasticadhaerens TaxID=2527974 RepID=A0A518H0U6_9BACT|nr:hypothetical protein [Tautonia plasticadhaerens]QDV34438.1 hypothetical protein ElP_23270 [Tautonia plasticadhaerens]
MGPITLAGRAYHTCPARRTGHIPIDAELGLAAGTLTPGAEEITTWAGTVGSFAEAAEKPLPRMAGLRLAESTVERTTEAAGERLSGLWAAGHALGPAADWRWNRDARGRAVGYVSVDAAGLGMPGDRGAKADGRMASVGKVFNPRAAPSEAAPKGHPPAARYQAGLMGLDELGARMRRQAAQVGLDRAERWVALTGGGAGRDGFMDVSFPRAVRVPDFDHAAEHLGDLAKAYCGGDAEAAGTLTGRWSHRMKHEGGGAIPATLEALDLGGRSAAAREGHRQVSGYIRNNLHRMDYPRYRAAGWQIGSGHIEAACKTVSGAGCVGAATGRMRCASCGRCTKVSPANGMPSGTDPSTDTPTVYRRRRRSPTGVEWRARHWIPIDLGPGFPLRRRSRRAPGPRGAGPPAPRPPTLEWGSPARIALKEGSGLRPGELVSHVQPRARPRGRTGRSSRARPRSPGRAGGRPDPRAPPPDAAPPRRAAASDEDLPDGDSPGRDSPPDGPEPDRSRTIGVRADEAGPRSSAWSLVRSWTRRPDRSSASSSPPTTRACSTWTATPRTGSRSTTRPPRLSNWPAGR